MTDKLKAMDRPQLRAARTAVSSPHRRRCSLPCWQQGSAVAARAEATSSSPIRTPSILKTCPGPGRGGLRLALLLWLAMTKCDVPSEPAGLRGLP